MPARGPRAPSRSAVFSCPRRQHPPRVLGLSVLPPTDHPSPLRALRRFAAEIDADAREPHQSGVPVTPTLRRPRRVSSSRFPSVVLRSVRPLQTPRRNARSSALPCHREGLVPSSWFRTTSTVSSGPTAQALLQPAADPGVHRVSRPAILHPGSRRNQLGQRTRARASRRTHPSKMLPAGSASSAHRATRRRRVHAKSLPPCRCAGGTTVAPVARGLRGSPWRLLRLRSTSRSRSAGRFFTAVCRFQQPTALSFHGLLFLP